MHTQCPDCNLIFTPGESNDEVKFLRVENERLKAENARYIERIEELTSELSKLKAQADRHREALEFYADDKNWIIRDDVQDVCVNDWSKKEKHSIPTAGNRAREALKGE